MPRPLRIAVGQRFGRLTIVEIVPHTIFALCRCECGTVTKVQRAKLPLETSRSCGCLSAELSSTRNATHRGSHESLYGVWTSMRARCENESHARYKDYGGRGIRVCTEWQEYPTFREWAFLAGYRKGLTLDRTNNDGDYEPTNCRWATYKEQANNRRKPNVSV
jgi:hypothetical protein